MKKVFICALLTMLFWNAGFCNSGQIVVKVCPLFGEKYVTEIPPPSKIVAIFSTQLAQKGYTVYTNSADLRKDSVSQKNLYYLDVFVFQIPGSYPTMKVVLRDLGGALFMDEQFIKLFSTRIAANLKLAKKLSVRFPEFERAQTFTSYVKVGSRQRYHYSLITGMADAMAAQVAAKYIIEYEPQENSTVQFPYDKTVEMHLKELIDLSGFRKRIKDHKMTLFIEIDEYGFTRIVKKDIPFKVNSYQMTGIDNMVFGFPLWVNPNGEKETAVIKIGTK